jgi:hypothetical protein
MTNVKIQMTNQIQMFKCLNDSVNNPDQRPRLHLLFAGPAGLFAESSFPTENQSLSDPGIPGSILFGHSLLCKA